MISLLNGLDDFQSFDHLFSFDIKQNFSSFIKSSQVIKDKPERVNMKFQSFDYKFALHYIDRSIFNDAIILIRNFYGYRFQIKYLHDTKNQFIRRKSLHNFNQSKLPKTILIDDDLEYDLPNKETDPNTFMADIFGIYRIVYRWFTSIKMVAFDQS